MTLSGACQKKQIIIKNKIRVKEGKKRGKNEREKKLKKINYMCDCTHTLKSTTRGGGGENKCYDHNYYIFIY